MKAFVDKLKNLMQPEPLQTLGTLQCPEPEPEAVTSEPIPEPQPQEDNRNAYEKHLELLTVEWSDPALLPKEPTSYDRHRLHQEA